MMLLLDWSKPFDRLKPEALVCALERFGVPKQMLSMITPTGHLKCGMLVILWA